MCAYHILHSHLSLPMNVNFKRHWGCCHISVVSECYDSPLIKFGDGQFMFVLKNKLTLGFLINCLQKY